MSLESVSFGCIKQSCVSANQTSNRRKKAILTATAALGIGVGSYLLIKKNPESVITKNLKNVFDKIKKSPVVAGITGLLLGIFGANKVKENQEETPAQPDAVIIVTQPVQETPEPEVIIEEEPDNEPVFIAEPKPEETYSEELSEPEIQEEVVIEENTDEDIAETILPEPQQETEKDPFDEFVEQFKKERENMAAEKASKEDTFIPLPPKEKPLPKDEGFFFGDESSKSSDKQKIFDEWRAYVIGKPQDKTPDAFDALLDKKSEQEQKTTQNSGVREILSDDDFFLGKSQDKTPDAFDTLLEKTGTETKNKK